MVINGIEIRIEVHENLEAFLINIPARARFAFFVAHTREQRSAARAGGGRRIGFGDAHPRT